MNKVNLIGRLTRDITLKYSQEQLAIGRTAIALDDYVKGEKKPNYINLIVFGKSAENMEKFTHKGSQVGITGKITTGSYEKEGRKVYTFDVVVESFDLLDKKSDEPKKEDVPSGFAQIQEDIPF